MSTSLKKGGEDIELTVSQRMKGANRGSVSYRPSMVESLGKLGASQTQKSAHDEEELKV